MRQETYGETGETWETGETRDTQETGDTGDTGDAGLTDWADRDGDQTFKKFLKQVFFKTETITHFS